MCQKVLSGGNTVVREPAPVVVSQEPPPPQVEIRTVFPGSGYTWLLGYWGWNGRRYAWHRGEWVLAPRTGAVWVEGHWERQPNGWVWVPGRWQ
jgi:hypothetical protein